MAPTPDTDNGYYRIANEIGEALARTELSGGARRILDVVMRRTWGYNKKLDWISLSQFVAGTGMTRKSVCRCLAELEDRIILVSKRTLGRTEYGINKHFSQWIPSVQTDTTSVQKDTRGSVQNVRKVVSKRTHTKDNITKDNNTDTNVSVAAPGKIVTDAPPPATINSEKKPILPTHLEPLAMYALLFDVKFPTKGEWQVFIKRNVRLSTLLAKLPHETLAAAMVLAEDHWAKKRDYEIRLETVHRFVENVGRDTMPAALQQRMRELLKLFAMKKLTVFLPTPANGVAV